MCRYVPIYVCVPCVSLVLGGQKDTLEQELCLSVSYHVDARNQNWSSGRGDCTLKL